MSGLAAKPKVLLFDVNETLLDVGPLKDKVGDVLQDPKAAELWFATMLQYSLAATVSSQYFAFPEIGAAVLRMLGRNSGLAISQEDAKQTLSVMTSLPAHKDVAPGLRRLKAAGFLMATLTNSSQEGVKAQLQSAELSSLFKRELSVESIGKFKPHADVYAWAAREMRAQPFECMLVAAHGWDVAGAKWAGMATAFIARQGQNKFLLAPDPDIDVSDLLALADALGA
jgi:2-haloacid dehalogenase